MLARKLYASNYAFAKAISIIQKINQSRKLKDEGAIDLIFYGLALKAIFIVTMQFWGLKSFVRYRVVHSKNPAIADGAKIK